MNYVLIDNIFKNCVFYDQLIFFNFHGVETSGIPNSGNKIINSIIDDVAVWGHDITESDIPNITYSNFWNNNFDTPSGTGNIEQDPLFADAANGDFHLKSEYGRWNGTSWVYDNVTSPCIDTGDPLSPIGDESAANGGRINMGAYGGTQEASKSL